MINILIPTDFSNNSWNAIKYGLAYFKNTECIFFLMHVSLQTYLFSGDVPLISSVEGFDKELVAKAKEELKKLLKRIKKIDTSKKHKFYTIAAYNFFIDAVKNNIEENNIDLIIMGTKGASGFKEVIIGSNTADLITQVKCPVLVVPENAVFKTPKELAFPTDYNSTYEPKILDNVAAIATKFKSFIRVLYVGKKDEQLTNSQKDNKELLNYYFSEIKHSFHFITNKKIEQGIQCFIESRDIDMIVMVAKNINLFQRIFLKPLVEEISYHTEIPFLVLHE